MEKSEITVDVSDVWLPFASKKPDYRVMLFLKKDESGYKPVARVNGYCVIDGEKIYRGHRASLRMSVSQLRSDIEKCKEGGE